jgi:hypothetical protein
MCTPRTILARPFRGIVLLEDFQLELQIPRKARRRPHAKFRIVEFETDVDDLTDG